MLADEFTAAILFVQQLGLALAGAACLWGLFFFFNSRSTTEEGKRSACNLIAGKLFIPFTMGFIVAFAAWLVKTSSSWSFIAQSRVRAYLQFTSANEGILDTVTALWIFLAAFTVLGIFLYRRHHEWFLKNINFYFVISFISAFVLISFPTGIGKYDIDRLFFVRHGFPLIFTIGTVMATDFVFFFSRTSLRTKRQIYPFMPTLSKLVWVGLGITFLWEWTGLDRSMLTSQFYFTQSVIAVIIINGMLFNGPLLEKLISGVSEKRVKPLSDGWLYVSEISGVVTFSCWNTITYLSFFGNLHYSLGTLWIAFIIKTVLVYLLLLLIEYVTDRPMSLVGTN